MWISLQLAWGNGVNNGDPIDLAPYQYILSTFTSLSWDTADVLEAAVVGQTKDNAQLIADYMVSNAEEKQKKYNISKQKWIANFCKKMDCIIGNWFRECFLTKTLSKDVTDSILMFIIMNKN